MEIAEKTAMVTMPGNIAGAVEADKGAYSADDQGKEQAQAIQSKAEKKVKAGYPRPIDNQRPPLNNVRPKEKKEEKQQGRQQTGNEPESAITVVSSVAVVGFYHSFQGKGWPIQSVGQALHFAATSQ
jgi:sRNA-binding protein